MGHFPWQTVSHNQRVVISTNSPIVCLRLSRCRADAKVSTIGDTPLKNLLGCWDCETTIYRHTQKHQTISKYRLYYIIILQ